MVPLRIFGQLVELAGGWFIQDGLIIWLAFGWILAVPMRVPGPHAFSFSRWLAWACSHGDRTDLQEKRKFKWFLEAQN